MQIARIAFTVLALALTPGVCRTAEPEILLYDGVDQIVAAYFITPDSQPEPAIMLAQLQGQNVVAFYLSAEDAAQLSGEMRPLVGQVALRRRFSRHVRLNADVDVEAAYDSEMRLIFRSSRGGGQITYTGAKALMAVDGVEAGGRKLEYWLANPGHRPVGIPRPDWGGHPGQRPQRPRPQGEDGDFTVTDVRVDPTGLDSRFAVKGRIRNDSRQSYRRAAFRMVFTNMAGREVGSAGFAVGDLQPGQTKNFETTTRDDIRAWKEFRIQPESLTR